MPKAKPYVVIRTERDAYDLARRDKRRKGAKPEPPPHAPEYIGHDPIVAAYWRGWLGLKF